MVDAETKTCPDCAETVLAPAKVCKHCGFRFDADEEDEPFELAAAPAATKPTRRVWPYLLAAVAAAIIVGGSNIGSPPTSRNATATSVAQPTMSPEAQDFAYVRQTQRTLSSRLKDPDSAQFGEDYVSRRSGAPVVCGSVNARNSFGGYTGTTRYVGAGDGATFMESEVPDFPDLWAKMC